MQAGGAERAERFSHDLDAGEVPRIPEETGIVKHQRAIGASFVAAALVAVLARFVQRRRKGGGGSSKKKKSRPPSKKACVVFIACVMAVFDTKFRA